MEIKYTSDGKKVAIVGKLNTVETIVQEIFVTKDGAEIHSGENFVVKSLHDAPVISWKENRIKEIDVQYKKDVEIREKELQQLKEKHINAVKQAEAKIQYLYDLVRNFNPEACKMLELFIANKINYIVHGYAITTSLEFYSNYYESLKLISLFGGSKGDLSYKINDYRDGSGGYSEIAIFETEQEAKDYLQTKLYNTEVYYDTHVNAAQKYGLNLDETKLNKYYKEKAGHLKGYINEYSTKITEYTKQLKNIPIEQD